jgi:hypothetical protein
MPTLKYCDDLPEEVVEKMVRDLLAADKRNLEKETKANERVPNLWRGEVAYFKYSFDDQYADVYAEDGSYLGFWVERAETE